MTLILLGLGSAQAQSGRDSGGFERLPDDQLTALRREPILLVAEGLDRVIDPDTLRARLGALFGRPVISLADPEASSALATLWAASNQHFIVLRLSIHGVDLWQRIPKQSLSGDAAGAIANAVIDMLWRDRLSGASGSEVLDPFCPPGLICVDPSRPAQRVYSLRRSPEPAVLDPWDPSYQRFSLLDSQAYWSRGDPWGAPTASPVPVRVEPAGSVTSPVRTDAPVQAGDPRLEQLWAFGALGGGGVHEAGGFVRYEVNALRRFPRFDVGLAFVGARGQPDPARSVRRAVTALMQRRFLMQALEIDLGAGFGIFVANNAGKSADVHPYLRGFTIFAIPMGRFNDFIVQSELATTFTDTGDAGALEYALAVGLRQRL